MNTAQTMSKNDISSHLDLQALEDVRYFKLRMPLTKDKIEKPIFSKPGKGFPTEKGNQYFHRRLHPDGDRIDLRLGGGKGGLLIRKRRRGHDFRFTMR
jgi:hypothetical protein